MRLTIICPAAHRADANHLAMILGYGPADIGTYGEPSWQDASGNLYTVASLMVSQDFITSATTALARPAWDSDGVIDMDAATRAQSLVVVWGLGDDEPEPVASPDAILALFDPDPLGVLARAGLTLVEQPPSQQV